MSSTDNPLSIKLKRRFSEQPLEVQAKLDHFRNFDYQLEPIKRSKPIISVGDVFVLSPRDSIYFYGKVLKTNIKTLNNDTFVEGKQTVFLHKCKTKKLTVEDFEPNYEDLLINPAIVDISYWQRGFFYNVGHLPLTDIEKSLNYGFYKLGIPGVRDGWFCTEEGERIDVEPKLLAMYGITTITGIAAKVETELIINPSLLE